MISQQEAMELKKKMQQRNKEIEGNAGMREILSGLGIKKIV